MIKDTRVLLTYSTSKHRDFFRIFNFIVSLQTLCQRSTSFFLFYNKILRFNKIVLLLHARWYHGLSFVCSRLNRFFLHSRCKSQGYKRGNFVKEISIKRTRSLTYTFTLHNSLQALGFN